MATDWNTIFAQILNALKQIESGDYTNHHSGSSASGAYQFIDSTWNNYGGYAHAYLAPPAVQDARALKGVTDLMNYWLTQVPPAYQPTDKNPDQNVIWAIEHVGASWYAGQGGAHGDWNAPMPGGQEPIQAYVDAFMQAYNGSSGTPDPGNPYPTITFPPPYDPAKGALDAYVKSAQSAALGFGETLSTAQATFNYNNGVSLSEWGDRLLKQQWLKDNEKDIPQFENELKAEGLLSANGSIDPYDLVKGLLPDEWLNVWRGAAGRIGAIAGGFQIGPGTGDMSLSADNITSFVNRLGGTGDVNAYTKMFSDAGTLLLQLGSWSRFKGMGITKTDAENWAANIIDAGDLAKITRLSAEHDAFSAFKPQLALLGIGGRPGQGLAG
jgi:hypothetical protein